MFETMARFVVRRRWWVILAWVVAAVVLVGFAPKFKVSNEQTDFLPGHYDSVRAVDVQAQAFPQAKGETAFIVATTRAGTPLTAADQRKVKALGATLDGDRIAGVASVAPGPVSPNKLVQILSVQFTGDFGDPEVADAVKALRTDLARTDPTGLNLEVTGSAAINTDSQESFEKSDQITLLATVIVIFVLLIFTFRSIVAALLPLFTVVLVMMVALSLIGTINKIFGLKADNLTQSLMPIVLFGIGTDYILFLLFRYRERLRLGEDQKTAMVSSVHKVGEVIASAALAVIIAFCALILASLGMLKSMGPAMGIAVATTLVAALTLIPAIVSLLGPRVFWPSRSWRQEPEHRLSEKLGTLIGRRPGLVALVSGLLLVGLSVLALGFTPNFDLASAPKGTESARGLASMSKGFPPGAQQVTQLYVTGDRPVTGAEVAAVADRVKATAGVAQVGKPLISADRRTALVEVQLAQDPMSNKAMDSIGPIRDAAHAAAPSGTTALVGGQTAIMTDLQSSMDRDYRVVFPIAGLLIAIVLGLLLRSLVAPIYLMLAVVLSFLGTIGAAVLLFQDIKGHSGVLFFLPIIVYLFVVALGTDYNILMISRLREEARAGRPPREGVVNAFKQTAPTIASAGLILAGSFATFLLASADLMQEMGTSVAIGVLLSAFVMSMFLVPAVTVLLGHAAWWPGHGDRSDPSATAPLVESKLDPATARDQERNLEKRGP
ncbi:MAG: efflux RND transporter permease subunit [Streptosporangiaceae bacterium]